MAGRVWAWAGAVVTVVAAAGLGAYFEAVGLDKADKLGSVFGVFLALAGLVVAVWGLIIDRRTTGQEPSRVSVAGQPSIAVEGDNGGVASASDAVSDVQMRATAGGQGRVYQAGGDQIINER